MLTHRRSMVLFTSIPGLVKLVKLVKLIGLIGLVGLAGTTFGCADAQPRWTAECEDLAAKPDGLTIAGSGASLAPLRLIVGRYRDRHPNRFVTVADSVGSAGAVQALRDDMIDIGLASRPLRADEARHGIIEFELARVRVAPTVHRDRGLETISVDDLAKIYDGSTTRWPDGAMATPLLRQAGDSTMRAMTRSSPRLGFAISNAHAARRFPVLYTDQQMRDALLTITGAIGFLDVGTIRLEELPLVALQIGSGSGSRTKPGSQTEGETRTEPMHLPLFLLLRADDDSERDQFVAFARSREMANLLLKAGYSLPAGTQTGTP